MMRELENAIRIFEARDRLDIQLWDVQGQTVFPVYAASGELSARAVMILYVGELDLGADVSRSGLKEHANGASWTVDVPNADFRSELEKFSQYLDEKEGHKCAEQVQKTGNSTATASS